MKSSDLKLNMRLEISVMINQRTEYVPVRVEELSPEYLTLSMPMWQGSLIPMRLRDKLAVRILFRDSYFGFKTTVIERRLKPVPVIVVERPQKIQPVEQRRGHVRVEAGLTLSLRLLSDNNNDFSACLAHTINISAGGLLLATDKKLKKGQMVLLDLFLPEAEVVSCKAKTVRVFSEADSPVKGRAGLQYEDISEKDRDKIARFVFSRQRELIKKGLLEG